jgi:hypothetical protein
MQQLSDSIADDDLTRQNPFDESPWSAATVEAVATAKQVYILPNDEDATVLYNVLDIPALGVPLRRLPQLTLDIIAGADIIYTFLTKSPPDLLYKVELGFHLKRLGWFRQLRIAPLDGELSVQGLWKISRNMHQEALEKNARRAREGLPPFEIEERHFESTITTLLAQTEVVSIARLVSRRRRKPPAADQTPSFPRLEAAAYTLRALQTKVIPDLQWTIEDLLPEGLAIMAGPPGLGKSMLLLQIALAVALGGKLLEVWQAVAGDVLYVGTEDNERRMRDRVSQLMIDEPSGAVWPDTLTVVHEVQTFDAGLIEQLDDWLHEHRQARLVIIDILADVKPPRTPHSDWYQDERRMGKSLDALAMRHHVCVLVSLHTNRLQHAEDPIDRVHGGSGLPGAAPTKTVLLPAQGFNKAVWHTRGRDTPREQHALTMVEGVWTYSGDGKIAQLTEERQAILHYFRLYPGYHTPQQVADARGKSRVTVTLLLRKLVGEGFLRKVGYGKYQLNGECKP